MNDMLLASHPSPDNHTDLWTQLELFQLDVPTHGLVFSERLARENAWSPSYTRRAIVEYKRFLYLAMTSSHVVCPSDAVDQVWHMHLTYTRSYWNDLCGELLGRPLHHGPTQGGSQEQAKHFQLYQQTLESYRQAFHAEPPADLWPAAEQRFGEDLGFVRINHHHHWIVPKPRWSRAVCGAASALLIIPLAQLAANPLDWRGPMFLALYLGLMALAILISWVGRTWLLHSTDSYQFAPGSADAIGPIDVAWMQGGPARAIDCALVELAQKDAITIEGDRIGAGKNLAKTRADHRVSELVLGSVRSSSIARQYSAICRDALVGIDGVRQSLVDKGLVLDRSQRTAAIAFPIALHGGLLAFAVAKAVVGVGRGKPIGLLLVAIVATVVVMVLFTVTVPKVTSAGKRLLAKLEKQVRLNPSKLVVENQSDANTIDNSAMLWSTAFLGAAALSTGPWTYWRTFLDNQHRNSSTSSGGCSTTGCGGDSGGGGCGGGGCGGCGGD
ncbi:MAG: TIGR04222 domain-containing membrane protein [Pirellulaceae bacterium]|jgi:uncharacterized protein (TIGR04222 family)